MRNESAKGLGEGRNGSSGNQTGRGLNAPRVAKEKVRAESTHLIYSVRSYF